jgi:hypothetical protein
MKGVKMIEFKTEEWLERHIINNFSNFFPFKFKKNQLVLLKDNSKGYDTIDIVGEDDNNEYIIELKRDYVRLKDIYQVMRYVDRYKRETIKNVKGYIVSPYFTDNVRLLAEKNNIIVLELRDYICTAGHNCCSHKLKKISQKPKPIHGGKRPGAGSKKRTPPGAKRRTFLLSDDEYKKAKEYLKQIRAAE